MADGSAKNRVAIVVQRFGEQVNGGAEAHALQLAHALHSLYEIDVLTSCALDDHTWAMHYAPGTSDFDGYRVHRFPHGVRNRKKKYHLPLRARLRFIGRRFLSNYLVPLVPLPRGQDRANFQRWLEAQGPYMPDLISYLGSHSSDYAAIIFFTALYHPAARGLRVDPNRSIFVPTLHDERAVFRPGFHDVFSAPAWVMYNTSAEMRLAKRLYGERLAPGEVCGLGVDLREPSPTDADKICTSYGLNRFGYLVYVGRVDTSKGCESLLQHFGQTQAAQNGSLKMVLVGRPAMDIPKSDAIVATGFVSEQIRNALIKNAAALVIPSKHESLSMVLLESLALGTPVLVNRDCEVLMDHLSACGTGSSYKTSVQFQSAVNQIMALDPTEREVIGQAGRSYVATNYNWPTVISKFQRAVDRIAQSIAQSPAQALADTAQNGKSHLS
jgi:glycosyltransferase involved in cell wall biosynthesis